MATITKKDLIDRIADRTGQKRSVVKESVQEFLNLIVETLAEGDRIEFREFGVFEVKERAARTAQNPRTLERVYVKAKRSIKFKPGRELRARLEETPPGGHENGTGVLRNPDNPPSPTVVVKLPVPATA